MNHNKGNTIRSRWSTSFEYAHAHNWGISIDKLERLGGAERMLRMSPDARAVLFADARRHLATTRRTQEIA